MDHDFVFVGGLHRSGTTLLARVIARHDEASGFRETEAVANEGQFLQSVYPIAGEFGGVGRFGFDERSHMTEDSPLATDENSQRMLEEWSTHWDLSKRVLVEKSPPNLLKLRFLQALFPDATFVVIMRHPIAVAYASRKWAEESLESLMEHWLVCHEIFLDDAPLIRRLMLVRYEDFVANPQAIVAGIHERLGLAPSEATFEAKTGINDAYFRRWKSPLPREEHAEIESRLEERVNRFGYSLQSPYHSTQPAPEVADLLDRVGVAEPRGAKPVPLRRPAAEPPQRAAERSGKLPRLAMALKVRDEGDILEANLRYHHALGIDHFIVTDNGSTDETTEILRRYSEAGLATVISEPGTDYRAQGAQWLTRMAELAASELHADWVIHTDADEFWWPVQGSLKDPLAEIPPQYGVVVAPRVEFVGRPDGPGSFAERLTIREAHARLQPKVAHRAEPDAVSMDRGAHDVAVEGARGLTETLRPPGRAVHRTVRDSDGAGEEPLDEDRRLVWAPTWPFRILHFPVRSFDQLKRRTEVLIFEGHYPDWGRSQRLRDIYEEGRFDEIYDELIPSDADVEEGIREGRLVRDERFARLLERCPDPLAGGDPGSVRVEPSREEAAADRAELEFDAMFLLARTSRWTSLQRDRNRERVESLQDDAKRATRQRNAARRTVKQMTRRIEAKNRRVEQAEHKLARKRKRVETLRGRLRAERARPWSRMRRRFKGLRRRVGGILGRRGSASA
jgi:Sulfotransferase family/Glycosyl transferase family 2